MTCLVFTTKKTKNSSTTHWISKSASEVIIFTTTCKNKLLGFYHLALHCSAEVCFHACRKLLIYIFKSVNSGKDIDAEIE